jgi:hypothetical protein
VSDKSHQERRHSAADGPPGLYPPPRLNWEAWRAHARDAKAAKGLSINVLTGRSGLDRSTVIELLGGRRGVGDVRLGTLWALAWALEVEDFAQFLAPLTADLGGRSDPQAGRPLPRRPAPAETGGDQAGRMLDP